MKEKGILLPIFSLPSNYGMGDFGNEAYDFVDILSKNGLKYCAILAINACNRYPYSPHSYYALDEDYVSIDKLIEHNLIDSAETREIKDRVDDDDYKVKYYKKAFENFQKSEEYSKFIKCKEIQEYAEFISAEAGESIEYNLFLQYILYRQWMELKEYANSKGVEIIGDMPIYPVFDSAETKFHPEYFEMENGEFVFEAGVPPDYFNSEGQRWGNPVYNVENMKKDNFEYLTKRFKYYLKLFNKVRVDHFRGYDSFFRIPIGKSVRDGYYSDGVSYGFFDELFKDNSIKVEDLIIEDLGNIREETVKLREHYGFTRQKILQFTLDLQNKSDFEAEKENMLVFPGNHDCPTWYGWYKDLTEEQQNKLKEFLLENKCNSVNVNIGFMEYCLKTLRNCVNKCRNECYHTR